MSNGYCLSKVEKVIEKLPSYPDIFLYLIFSPNYLVDFYFQTYNYYKPTIMDNRIIKFLSGELNDSERGEFLNDINENENLKQEFIRTQNLFSLTHLVEHSEDKEIAVSSFKQFLRKIKTKKRKIIIQNIGKVAAIALLVIASTVFFTLHYERNKNYSNNYNTLYVPVGQKAELTLQDGTVVWLNAKSTLTYPSRFSAKERKVSLDGEAYFEVAKDKKRTFIVSAHQISVYAIGTIFDVKAYSEENFITTTLIEGKVNVTDSKNMVKLLPNQKVIFNLLNHTFQKSNMTDSKSVSLWKNNQLAFDSETLENIAKVLERMYNVHIEFANDKIKGLRFSGKIKNDSLESVLRNISLTSPIHYKVVDSIIILNDH
jgi:ferric-dicitrate binding protein FerR (iron transport regulator)